jgi:S1-C subfamily serine protease
MRGAGLGLIALLLGVGLMFYLMYGGAGPGGTSYMQQVGNARKDANQQVNQMSGRDEQGNRASNATQLSVETSGGKTRGIKVDSIGPESAIAKAYGLKAGDVITGFGPLGVDDITDADGAAAQLDDAFARKMALSIRRDGKEMTLEQTGGGGAGGVPGLKLP